MAYVVYSRGEFSKHSRLNIRGIERVYLVSEQAFLFFNAVDLHKPSENLRSRLLHNASSIKLITSGRLTR
jgi:hypothetical protein